MENRDKKTRILQAATEIFARLPYHQVKMEEIALQANVGKGTIYEYFAGKDDLFFSMMEHSSQAYLTQMVHVVRTGSTVKEKLQILLQYHLSFIDRNADMAHILVTDRRIPHQQCQELILQHRKQLLQLVTALLNEGISSREFRPLDSEAAAHGIVGTLYALWGQALLDQQQEATEDKRIETILDFFFNGLAPRP